MECLWSRYWMANKTSVPLNCVSLFLVWFFIHSVLFPPIESSSSSTQLSSFGQKDIQKITFGAILPKTSLITLQRQYYKVWHKLLSNCFPIPVIAILDKIQTLIQKILFYSKFINNSVFNGFYYFWVQSRHLLQ